MDSSVFLENATPTSLKPVYVVHGDEDFLKRRVLARLRECVFGKDEESLGWSVIAGDKADFASVRDELSTLGFLSERRLVQIDQADPFVTHFRAQLEKYVAEPSSRGILVLEVKSWTSTTKLAKLVPADATLVCKTLPMGKLPDWCTRWARTSHGKQMSTNAARLLVELIGEEMGLLDQELAKLAAYVGSASKIDVDDVDKLVGNSRAETIWKMFDFIGSGRMDEALRLLDRLFDQGEEPIRMLGAFSMQLRRLARAASLASRGLSMNEALTQAGILSFAMRGAEQQLRHLGKRRIERVYDWLLELDSGLKGGNELPPRLQMERLIIQLARPEPGQGAKVSR
jgi:DNA polymerase III subunit delta